MSLFNEQAVPPELVPKARAWFDSQMAQLEKAHGDRWPDHREWLADYLNEELRERASRVRT